MNDLIKARLVYDGGDTVSIPPEMGTPRADQMQGTPAEVLTETAGRICFDPQTQVLTQSGWIDLCNLPRGDSVATFNLTTRQIEFQTPTDYIRQSYVGKMYRVLNHRASIFCTPDHNILTGSSSRKSWRLRPASDVFGTAFQVLTNGIYQGESAGPIELPCLEYTQRANNEHHIGRNSVVVSRRTSGSVINREQLAFFAELIGFYVSEGSISTNRRVVSIYQCPGPTLDHICGLIKAMGWTCNVNVDHRNGCHQVRIGNASLARYLARECGTRSQNKRIPAVCLTWPIELRSKLLNAAMQGDGGVCECGSRVYNTSSPKLADDIQQLIATSGRHASISISKTAGTSNIRGFTTNYDMQRVREGMQVAASVNKHSQQDSWIDYSGEVFCVTVDNGTLLTRRDRNIVVLGNCYDSCGTGRPSFTYEVVTGSDPHTGEQLLKTVQGYHDHILEVGHGSVLEHFNFTIEIEFGVDLVGDNRKMLVAWHCMNRPGVLCLPVQSPAGIRLTMNLRSALEWNNWSKEIYGRIDDQFFLNRQIAFVLQHRANEIAPHIIQPFFGDANLPFWPEIAAAVPVDPICDNERWISMYMSGSRGLSHELVRHGDFTAISQRSTRFVDESESPWVEHPLTDAYVSEVGPVVRGALAADFVHADDHRRHAIRDCRKVYDETVKTLEPWLIARGIDKTSARKQARGAARGYLGNALSTELIFSANVAQWHRMLRQRASRFADAEIRELFCKALVELKRSRYAESFAGFELEPSPDGIGQVAVEK